jgi:ankyrin repeat protein
MTVPEEPAYTEQELEKLWSDYMIEGARYGDLDDVVEALKRNAKVDATDDNGGTALHMAAGNAHLQIAQLLLKAGANTEAKNKAGNTALHWACLSQSPGEHCHTSADMACMFHVSVLLHSRRHTPSVLNTHVIHAAIVQMLLQHGANPAAVNDAGQVPFDNALDNAAIQQLFQEHSAAADRMGGDETQGDAGAAANQEKVDAQGLEIAVEGMSLASQP